MYKLLGMLFAMLFAIILAVAFKDHTPLPAKDPTPATDLKERYHASKVVATSIGNPITVDDCEVRLHEVFVGMPDAGDIPWSITMATAKCPTAVATATHEYCGKNCVRNALRVEPMTPAADTAAASSIRDAAKQPTLALLEAELTQDPSATVHQWGQELKKLSRVQRQEHQIAILRAKREQLSQLEQAIHEQP